MRFPVAISQDNQDYRFVAYALDIPLIYSYGNSIDEVIASVEKNIFLSFIHIFDQGEALPEPTSIDSLQKRAEFANVIWAYAYVDLSIFSNKAIRINITLPQNLLSSIDDYVSKKGETRSGFLARAAQETMDAADHLIATAQPNEEDDLEEWVTVPKSIHPLDRTDCKFLLHLLANPPDASSIDGEIDYYSLWWSQLLDAAPKKDNLK
jgi:predicted RNase H-like HicB family nuclease